MNIKYKISFITLLATMSLMVISCEDDDELDVVNIPSQSSAVVSLSFDQEPFFGRGGAVDYTVDLQGSSSLDRQVKLSSQTGTQRFSDIAVAESGTSVAEGTFTIPNIGGSLAFDEKGSFSTSVVGVRQGELVADEEGDEFFNASGGDTVATTSDPITVEYFDRTPSASSTGLNYLLDWNNPSVNDLDLFVIDEAFTDIFENSETGSRYENDVFNNTNLDGKYDFYISIFDLVNEFTTEAINSRLFVIDSRGNKTLLEFTIPAGTATNDFTLVGTFTQTTSAEGEVNYSNITLL